MPEYNMKLLQNIQAALVEVRPLINVEGTIPADSVKKIYDITARLDEAIVTKVQ